MADYAEDERGKRWVVTSATRGQILVVEIDDTTGAVLSSGWRGVR